MIIAAAAAAAAAAAPAPAPAPVGRAACTLNAIHPIHQLDYLLAQFFKVALAIHSIHFLHYRKRNPL
jgi:hypothetical protein